MAPPQDDQRVAILRFLLFSCTSSSITTGWNDWQSIDERTTDLGTRLGTCGVPVPQALSCREMPEWGGFLLSLQENARAGFPMDPQLYKEAWDILHKWQDKPYPPQDFFKYICGGPEATWPVEDRFCLYGFVGALFVRSRHMMLSDDVDARKAADMDFQYATTVLGKEGAVDFLDSSPWPVNILDLYLNINQTDFMSYEEYSRKSPVRQPVVLPESIHWQLHAPSCGQASVDCVVGLRMPPSTTMAVLGTHATLSLEPVDMLRRFVHDVQLRAVFYGLEPRWCQILGVCDQGTTALSQLFKDAEKDPYSFPWDVMIQTIGQIYESDDNLRSAQLLLCTEPLAGCLMLREVANTRGRQLPLLGYLGVALLNSCPPENVDKFWNHFSDIMTLQHGLQKAGAVLAVNNLILSEQIFYQTGKRLPYVRAHGLYTGMSYTPLKNDVLMWRAPLFMYSTMRCVVERFLQGMPDYPVHLRFVDETENLAYKDIAEHRAVVLVPWDHALMTFYELYSAAVPMMLPATEWMYRFLYQRGQLSVGERMYQAVMPGHTPPHVEYAEDEVFLEKSGPPAPHVGLSSAKAARGVAEDMLTRGLATTDLDSAHQYIKAALDLMKDQKYFLTVAENRTDKDSYTSMGVVRRSSQQSPQVTPGSATSGLNSFNGSFPPGDNRGKEPWHPYTPFQMSPLDSNDWTRMRKGGWWLRRGIRFDAMRYWYQFSDFGRFPGLHYFGNLPDLFCLAKSLDVRTASENMRRYNEKTLVHSAAFWVHSLTQLLATEATTS